jgi:hypothetical protein
MVELRTRLFPIVAGLVIPLALLITNAVWGYGGILLTIASVVWIGFAVVLITPGGAQA